MGQGFTQGQAPDATALLRCQLLPKSMGWVVKLFAAHDDPFDAHVTIMRGTPIVRATISIN